MFLYNVLVINRWKNRISKAKTKDEVDIITYDMAYDEHINPQNYCKLFDFAQSKREKLVGIAV